MSVALSDATKDVLYRYRYVIFFGLVAIVSVLNLTIDIMEVDAAQYASISRSMSESGSFLQIFHRGEDYLDKPPLLFWLSSLSISFFGNTNFGYKLPAFLLLCSSVWAVYKYGRLWYSQKTGWIAALIFSTSQAFYLMTNDVRTDGIFTSFVILSVYFLSVFLKFGRTRSLIIGGIFIGLAMLAKGPLGIIIPAVAIAGHLLLSGQWKKILSLQWLLLLPIVLIVLAPMLYGLYMQFDLHPEKEVYGIKGPSGLEFYFWTQSFGRITGESSWQNDSSFFYFLQTIFWDFAPWIFLFIPAFIFKLKTLFRRNPSEENKTEWITFCGFLIPFIALSFSNYKLPHYIFPLFPFAAIITADFIVQRMHDIPGRIELALIIFLHVFIAMAVLSFIWVFPSFKPIVIMSGVVLYGLFWWSRHAIVDRTERLVFSICSLVLIFQFTFSLHFYPSLLKYQSTSQAGKIIAAENPTDAYWYRKYGYALDYYAGYHLPELRETEIPNLKPEAYVYTDEEGLDEFSDYEILRTFEDYPVTLLRLPFLDPKSRAGVVKKIYLIKLKAKKS